MKDRKLKAILDSSIDNNILISPDYTILSFNLVAEKNNRKFFTKKLKEGALIWDCLSRMVMNVIALNLKKAFLGNIIEEDREFIFSDKLKIWFQIRYFPVYDQSNELIGVFLSFININKRKVAEELLIDNNILLKQSQKLAQMGSWQWDITNDKVIWTDELYNIYGLDKNAFLATFEGYLSLVHPDDREKIKAIIQETLQYKKQVSFEERIIRPNGELRYLKSWGMVLLDENNRPSKMFGTCMDITEQKNAEKEIHKQQEILTQAERIANIGNWEFDVQANQLYWSDEVYRICGYEPHQLELTFENAFNVIHPEDREKALQVFQNTLTKGNAYYIEKRFVRPDNSIRFIVSRAELKYDTFGNPHKLIGVFHDITEIKKNEKLLQEISEIARIGGWEINLINEQITWTAVTKEIYEVEPDYQYTKQSKPQFYKLKETLNKVNQLYYNVMHHGTPFDEEFQIVTAKGNKRWLRATGRIEKVNEVIVRAYGINQDITFRKNAELALKESESKLRESVERYNLAIQATRDGIWDWNILTNEEYFSPIWCKIIGYTFDDPTLSHSYESWASRIHPDFKEMVESALKAHLETNTPYNVEYLHRHKSGAYRWQRSVAQAVFDQEGIPIRMVGAISDIHESKEAQLQLIKEKEFSEKLIANLPDGFTLLDSKGVHLDVNEAFCRMTGYSKEELIGMSVPHIYWDEDYIDNIRNAFEKTTFKDGLNFELIFKRKNGEKIYVIVSLNSLENEQGQITNYFATIKDITERKQAEEEIKKSNERFRLLSITTNDALFEWNLITNEIWWSDSH